MLMWHVQTNRRHKHAHLETAYICMGVPSHTHAHTHTHGHTYKLTSGRVFALVCVCCCLCASCGPLCAVFFVLSVLSRLAYGPRYVQHLICCNFYLLLLLCAHFNISPWHFMRRALLIYLFIFLLLLLCLCFFSLLSLLRCFCS